MFMRRKQAIPEPQIVTPHAVAPDVRIVERRHYYENARVHRCVTEWLTDGKSVPTPTLTINMFGDEGDMKGRLTLEGDDFKRFMLDVLRAWKACKAELAKGEDYDATPTIVTELVVQQESPGYIKSVLEADA